MKTKISFVLLFLMSSCGDDSGNGNPADMSVNAVSDLSMVAHPDMAVAGGGDMAMAGGGDMAMAGGGDMTLGGGGDMAVAPGDMSGKPVDMVVINDLAKAGDGPVSIIDGSVVGPKTWDVAVGPNNTTTFSPANLTIRVGDTVKWTWMSGGHNVINGTNGVPVNGGFCSPFNMGCANAPTSNANAVYQFMFAKAGVFPYYCAPHVGAGMSGTITVQ